VVVFPVGLVSEWDASVKGEHRLDRSARQGVGDRGVDLGERIVLDQPVDREAALPVQLEQAGMNTVGLM
jgi:hypothetical protein